MQEDGTCYACPQPGTSREHVPPKNLFPLNFRSNLITVPSCDKHNSAKSGDDELFRHVVAAAEGTNEFALEVYEPVIRSFERRPHILPTFMPGVQQAVTTEGETIGCRVDQKRFERSVRSIVRALYYYENQKRLHADLLIVWGLFRNTSNISSLPLLPSIKAAERQFGPLTKGAHPRIFQYDFGETTERRKSYFVCRLRFYESLPIYILWPQ